MDRRNILAAGAVAPILAMPAITPAQTRIRWRMPGSFPKSLEIITVESERRVLLFYKSRVLILIKFIAGGSSKGNVL